MSFRIRGLDPAPFRHLFGADAATLAAHGAIRCTADAPIGYPCRVEVRDADPGATLLLLNYLHQPADTPYRASHAIFIREGAERELDLVDAVPEALARRLVSLRAFDAAHMMTAAEAVDGSALAPAIERLLSDPAVAYLQAHYAVRGCYAARIERVTV